MRAEEIGDRRKMGEKNRRKIEKKKEIGENRRKIEEKNGKKYEKK